MKGLLTTSRSLGVDGTGALQKKQTMAEKAVNEDAVVESFEERGNPLRVLGLL